MARIWLAGEGSANRSIEGRLANGSSLAGRRFPAGQEEGDLVSWLGEESSVG